MPRPSGKAQKIAEQTIPGLNMNQRGSFHKKSKGVPKDEVELKIVNINENKGKLYNEKRKTRRQGSAR